LGSEKWFGSLRGQNPPLTTTNFTGKKKAFLRERKTLVTEKDQSCQRFKRREGLIRKKKRFSSGEEKELPGEGQGEEMGKDPAKK